MKNILLSTTFFIIIFLLSNHVVGDVTKSQKLEITHLLNFVENGDCLFIRNGSEHLAKESKKHIVNKYEYFKDDIKTTEEFIEYSATKSTLSGQFYTVNCPNSKTIRAQDWLLNELNDFRSK